MVMASAAGADTRIDAAELSGRLFGDGSSLLGCARGQHRDGELMPDPEALQLHQEEPQVCSCAWRAAACRAMGLDMAGGYS